MSGEAPHLDWRGRLDPPPERVREMAAQAVDWLVTYLGGLRERAVYPRASAAALRAELDQPLPALGRSLDELLELFDRVVVANSRHNGHPRSLGYVSSPGTAIATIADFLASGLNANLTAWRSAPGPVQLERVAIDWIKQALGFDPAGIGLFTSGGSTGNLAGLAAARERHTAGLAGRDGVRALERPLVLYASSECHHSIDKAAALLGLGRASVRRPPLDRELRIDAGGLAALIAADRAAGLDPFCIVGSAGTVVTGAIDPLAELVALGRREGLWVHVDGAYGGFAALAPSVRPSFAGLGDADSISLDPHKWLYQPVDCGCVLYRDPQAARAAFALDADYTRVLDGGADESFAFWDYGPDLSRRFRALKVWMTIAHLGADGLAAAVESDLECARVLRELVTTSDDFELIAGGLSIVCFRFVPAELRGRALDEVDQRAIDLLNERLLVAMQRRGSSYVSNATVDGRFALRACIINYRTTAVDMRRLLDDARHSAATVEAEPREDHP